MKISETIEKLKHLLEKYGDLEFVEIEEIRTYERHSDYVLTEIEPMVVTNPNNLKEKVIIFD
jgi:hypothetical protein